MDDSDSWSEEGMEATGSEGRRAANVAAEGRLSSEDQAEDYTDSFDSDSAPDLQQSASSGAKKVKDVAPEVSQAPQKPVAKRKKQKLRSKKIQDFPGDPEYLKTKLWEVTKENEALKRIQKSQEKHMERIKREGSEESSLKEEIRVLKEQIRQQREKAKERERILKQRSQSLEKTTAKLAAMSQQERNAKPNGKTNKGAKELKGCLEEELQNKAAQIQELERKTRLLDKNYKHQLNIEIARHKQTKVVLQETREALEDNKRRNIPSKLLKKQKNKGKDEKLSKEISQKRKNSNFISPSGSKESLKEISQISGKRNEKYHPKEHEKNVAESRAISSPEPYSLQTPLPPQQKLKNEWSTVAVKSKDTDSGLGLDMDSFNGEFKQKVEIVSLNDGLQLKDLQKNTERSGGNNDWMDDLFGPKPIPRARNSPDWPSNQPTSQFDKVQSLVTPGSRPPAKADKGSFPWEP